MVNHPNRRRGPYTAILSGASWSHGPSARFDSLRECLAYAESYGTTADRCTVQDAHGNQVDSYARDTAGDGTRWYRASL